MKKIAFLFSVLLIALFSSCNKDGKVSYEEYLIFVDSVQVADTVNLGAKFEVVFYGIIGSDGCYSFSRFDSERENSRYKIMVIGKKKTGVNLACPEYLPMLNGENLELLADSSGTLKIDIINPGLNQVLSKEIFVKE